ncbi:hypothetical protein PENSPDRAFT_650134 [Peniophora sp. CONT]|nr:hypothetical protein PENSPDRAFT_650134 [Peniophora sp. CONT]
MSSSKREGSSSVVQRQGGMPPPGLLFADASKTRGGRPPVYQPNASRPADTPSHRGVPSRTSPHDSMGSNLLSSPLGVPPLEMQRGESYTGSPISIARAASPAWESEALAIPRSRPTSSVRSASSTLRAPSPPPLVIRQPYYGAEDAYGGSPVPFRSQTPPARPSAASSSQRRTRTASLSSSQSRSVSAGVHAGSPLRAVQHAPTSSTASTFFSQDEPPRVRASPPRREWASSSAYGQAEMPRATTSYAASRSSSNQYANTRRGPRRPNVDTDMYSPMPMQPGAGSPASWHAPLREATWSPASDRSTASAPSYRQPPAVPRREGELKTWQHWYHELSPSDQLRTAQRLMPREETETPQVVSVASLDTSVKTMREEIEERDMRLRAWKKQREIEAGWAENKREAQGRR